MGNWSENSAFTLHTESPSCSADKSHLITRHAPWLVLIGVVPPAVDGAVLVEVDEVYEQDVAGGTGEAGRVPVLGHLGREHRYTVLTDALTTFVAGLDRRCKENRYKLEYPNIYYI